MFYLADAHDPLFSIKQLDRAEIGFPLCTKAHKVWNVYTTKGNANRVDCLLGLWGFWKAPSSKMGGKCLVIVKFHGLRKVQEPSETFLDCKWPCYNRPVIDKYAAETSLRRRRRRKTVPKEKYWLKIYIKKKKNINFFHGENKIDEKKEKSGHVSIYVETYYV